MNQIFPHYSINNKPKFCKSPLIRRFHMEHTGNNYVVPWVVFRGSLFRSILLSDNGLFCQIVLDGRGKLNPLLQNQSISLGTASSRNSRYSKTRRCRERTEPRRNYFLFLRFYLLLQIFT